MKLFVHGGTARIGLALYAIYSNSHEQMEKPHAAANEQADGGWQTDSRQRCWSAKLCDAAVNNDDELMPGYYHITVMMRVISKISDIY